MNSNQLSPPSAKQPKLSPTCGIDIDKLADAELAEIFKHLPPLDRLLISGVCKRWNGISRMAWLDITELDLSPIPGPNMAAIIRQCPSLRHVIAVRKTFQLNELHVLARRNLTSVKLYACTAFIEATVSNVSDAFSAVFSGNLPAAAWEELVLHDFLIKLQMTTSACSEMVALPRRKSSRPSPTSTDHREAFLAHPSFDWSDPDEGKVEIRFRASFPASIKRLQISGALSSDADYHSVWTSLADDIEQRSTTEALILHCKPSFASWMAFRSPDAVDSLASVQNLRELDVSGVAVNVYFEDACMALPRLEVLFLHSVNGVGVGAGGAFSRIGTQHTTLRILALTGTVSADTAEFDFPARIRYGNGFSADPLPVLHIFVGKVASENIRFPNFASDAGKVYPISEPLPEFLEREDIKPIFAGVWIAEKIKEAEKHGDKLFEYEEDIATSVRPIDT